MEPIDTSLNQTLVDIIHTNPNGTQPECSGSRGNTEAIPVEPTKQNPKAIEMVVMMREFRPSCERRRFINTFISNLALQDGGQISFVVGRPRSKQLGNECLELPLAARQAARRSVPLALFGFRAFTKMAESLPKKEISSALVSDSRLPAKTEKNPRQPQ